MAMTSEEWQDVSTGDVLQLDSTGMTYVVLDTSMISEGALVLSRVLTAMNPPEWTRRRKTVDAEVENYCQVVVAPHWDTGLEATTETCNRPLPCVVHNQRKP
jgi:hypothetical protein